MNHTRVFFLLLFGGLLVFVFVASLSHRPCFILNVTESLPSGLYRLSALPMHLQSGDIVAFYPPLWAQDLIRNRGWMPGKRILLLKPIAATSGDCVCVTDEALFINNTYFGPVLTEDRQQLPLPSYRGCQTLKDNEVFLASSRHRSFDSRYFGPARVDDVLGVATPLWLFGGSQ